MLVLSLRTDKPEAELGLFDSQTQLDYIVWQAHRQLSETLHTKINELLERQKKSLQDIDGIVCFKGPGSFTGLRIGLSVANALAYGLAKPVIASNATDWIQDGIRRLEKGEQDKVAVPEYGADVFITQPKK